MIGKMYAAANIKCFQVLLTTGNLWKKVPSSLPDTFTEIVTMENNKINNKSVKFFELSLLNVIFFILAKKITNIIRGKIVIPNSISWTPKDFVTLFIISKLNLLISG